VLSLAGRLIAKPAGLLVVGHRRDCSYGSEPKRQDLSLLAGNVCCVSNRVQARSAATTSRQQG